MKYLVYQTCEKHPHLHRCLIWRYVHWIKIKQPISTNVFFLKKKRHLHQHDLRDLNDESESQVLMLFYLPTPNPSRPLGLEKPSTNPRSRNSKPCSSRRIQMRAKSRRLASSTVCPLERASHKPRTTRSQGLAVHCGVWGHHRWRY